MVLLGGQLGGRHFVDPSPLGFGGVVAQQLAGPAVLAQECVVLLQVSGRYGYHQPLQGIREGFGGSGGVVWHSAKLCTFDYKYAEN